MVLRQRQFLQSPSSLRLTAAPFPARFTPRPNVTNSPTSVSWSSMGAPRSRWNRWAAAMTVCSLTSLSTWKVFMCCNSSPPIQRRRFENRLRLFRQNGAGRERRQSGPGVDAVFGANDFRRRERPRIGAASAKCADFLERHDVVGELSGQRRSLERRLQFSMGHHRASERARRRLYADDGGDRRLGFEISSDPRHSRQ